MKFNFSLDVAIIISLIAIFLFASGQADLGGFLRAFHIDPIVLNFSIQDKVYWGYLKGLNPIAYTLLIIIIYFSIRYIDTTLQIRDRIDALIITFLRKKFNFKLKHQPPIFNQNSKIEVENNFFSSIIFAILIYGLFTISLSILVDVEKRGRNRGDAILANPSKLPLVKITGTETNLKQYRILCGSALCAVIDEKKNVSLVEPKNVVYLSSNFAEKPEKQS